VTYPVLNQCDGSRSHGVTTYQACTATKVFKNGSGGGSGGQGGGGGNNNGNGNGNGNSGNNGNNGNNGSSNTGYTTYANTVASVNSSSARTALNANGFWSGTINGSSFNLFTGNYINYLLGTCAAGGACIQTKMQVAQDVVAALLDNVHDVRFGLMTFYYGSGSTRGARVIAQVGTNVATMKTAVYALTPTGDTPLGDSLYDAGQYYKGAALTNGSTFTSPIQLACQPNFTILITDGVQTSGARTMANEATNRFTQDHASGFSGTQNVIVHTVGFGVSVSADSNDTATAYADLATAARNGGGQFYISDDKAQLERALQDAIRRIVQATFTFATPVLPTTSTTGSTRAYLAAFRSDPSAAFWQGYLKAYQRNSQGLVPVDSNGVPLSSALVWEAGQQLTGVSAGSRTITTVASVTSTTSGTSTTGTGSLTAFTKTNSAITNALLGVNTTTAHDKVIDFVRGIDAYDENQNNNTTEDRAWKLGDIFHSTPVLVSPPIRALNDSSYQTFKSQKASRTTVLIAGSNDGMLHAFRESDGAELWAFIPPDLLDNLQNLTVIGGEHDFFVDGSPVAVDIKVSGTWKTIVVFGERRGGATYHALDITDTTSPTYLWSFTDSKIRESWSEPAIGKMKINGADKYVAFFGGGYDTPQNNAHGKAVFAIDLATGTKLWEYYNDGSNDDRQYMNFSIPANPTAVDLDSDGYVDHVYIGDVGGQLWKFDVSGNATSSWTGKRLFAGPSQTNPPASGEYYAPQAIYGAPTLALDTSLNVWVFFGTGDRNHPNNTATNRFYGIKETTSMGNGSALTESSLVDVTSTNATVTTGWYIRLASNEKVLAAANVFNMNVFFSSFTPTTTVTCDSGGGTAKLYAVDLKTGYGAVNFSTGAAVTSPSADTARSATIGVGIASMPVIVVTPPATPGGSATSSVITATSNQQLPSNPVPPPPFMKQVRSWRERIN